MIRGSENEMHPKKNDTHKAYKCQVMAYWTLLSNNLITIYMLEMMRNTSACLAANRTLCMHSTSSKYKTVLVNQVKQRKYTNSKCQSPVILSSETLLNS